MKKTVIALLGGDVRMHFAANKLLEYGYDVREWGTQKGESAIDFCQNAKLWFDEADVIMLPLPSSRDGTHLWTPIGDESEKLRMETIFSMFRQKLFLVGNLGETLRNRADREEIRWIDYFESEILQLKNALPTAEGAIEIAMRELPVVLAGTKAAVIGYGRIGEVLAQKLKLLEAKVTVYARRPEVCARAELVGLSAKRILGEDSLLFDADTRVVFNTVPKRILTGEVLSKFPRDCLIIDLASAPGGVDTAEASTLGIRTLWATALPGKCAPESAGIILGETAHAILLDQINKN